MRVNRGNAYRGIRFKILESTAAVKVDKINPAFPVYADDSLAGNINPSFAIESGYDNKPLLLDMVHNDIGQFLHKIFLLKCMSGQIAKSRQCRFRPFAAGNDYLFLRHITDIAGGKDTRNICPVMAINDYFRILVLF